MKKLLFIVVCLMTFTGVKAQLVAVSADGMMALMQTPSVGVELVVGERSTVGTSMFFNYQPWGMTMKMAGLQPEYRYYFSGRPMHGYFVGVGGLGATYDIDWKGKRYDGTALGLGMTFGYVLTLTKRLNIDFHAGFGVITYQQREYFLDDNYEGDFSYTFVTKTNASGYTLLPTRLGVSVSYILK